MKIPFVGPSNTARSYTAAVERSVNCYLEKNSDPERPWALYGTPGLTLRATLGTSPVRGAVKMGDLTFWVAGNTVYKMDASYTATSLGTIGTSSGRVGIATNGEEVLIVDGVSGWIADASALTEIADADFPDGVTIALCLDSYFIVLGDGTQQAYWSESPGSGTAWNGLDFASAEGMPDILIGGCVDHRELWLFGTESTEVWVNTGDVDAPFQRSGNTFIEQGAASGWTAQSIDNAVMWLGANENGEGIVFRSEGYTPVRISTHALETAMRGYSTIADAFAWCYQLDGHVFYVLTFPTADATWFYDAASQQWFEWLWRDAETNEFHRHRSVCHVFANRKHLVGDWESGKVYSLEPEVYTDDGEPIRRLRRTQTLSAGNKPLFFGELLVDIETGVANADSADPQLMLRYSNDNGNTWSNEKTKSLGAVGEYSRRVKYGPTGSSKRGKGRVWELSITDPVKFALFGADVEVEAGS
jgi:hypothetical protein